MGQCNENKIQGCPETVEEINPKWSKYDKAVASAHLHNYGKIYLDAYKLPIDNEYELEELSRGELS